MPLVERRINDITNFYASMLTLYYSYCFERHNFTDLQDIALAIYFVNE